VERVPQRGTAHTLRACEAKNFLEGRDNYVGQIGYKVLLMHNLFGRYAKK
jgi:hypothetical protein